MNYFILDLDSTIAIAGERQIFFSKPKNFAAAQAGCIHDEIHRPTFEIVRLLIENGYECVVISARSENARDMSIKWLNKIEIPFKHVLLRNEGDYNPDYVIKETLLDEAISLYNGDMPFCAFDDREDVIKMFVSKGVPCFQVHIP